MDIDSYQAETAFIAREQSSLLDEVCERLQNGDSLSRLEQNGILHALQVLVENAIGKAKQLLKASGEPVPTSAYDAFSALTQHNKIPAAELGMWHAAVGLRNRIVHDYMNIDMKVVLELVRQRRYTPITAFLLQPFPQQDKG